MSELKTKTVKGMLWGAAERFSVQGVQFVVMLVMARLLTPRDYGLVGMIAIFTAVSQVLVESGFTQALIRKKDRSRVDDSTVFYFNTVLSLVLYGVLYLGAPLVARFYDMPELTQVMRVISIVVVVNAFGLVQRAVMSVNLDFKSQAKASFTAAIISGIAGITLALTGHGVWALVWQQILNAAIATAMLWVLAKWRPVRAFSWSSFKELFAFGSKLMVSALLDQTWNNIYGLVIGKFFRADTLGYYTRASSFAQLPTSSFAQILSKVSYPSLCKLQEDEAKLAESYRKFLRMAAFAIFPLTMLLAGIASPMTVVLIGEKWLYAGTLLTIICFSLMWMPIHAVNLNLLVVKGRSDLFLRLELYKKGVAALLIVATIPLGIEAVCWGQVASSIIAFAINTRYTGQFINMGFFRQLHDITPSLGLSLLVFAASYSATYIFANAWASLAVSAVAGLAVAAIAMAAHRFTEFDELKAIIRNR
ncbi:MAG: lipopolysaccharide biosynthesis protein [Candidatus Amulumruptor caecigallinarius]|nr:lipopolysaccharide biosynthesis protein [Candidatus Amulumruptor caecigallinarius]MCM1396010.1 lipopolysaccharide biosynthesis protein [Candidatus Amulumruptor caecigallinarius]MCM1454554.1 lipopolysaccharide biosynthesis protein [bacterium]